MRRITLIIALFPLLAQAEGTLTIQPQSNNSIRILSQGRTGSGGDDVLGFQQSSSGAMTLSVTPSGMSQCENGDIVLEGLRVSLTNMLDNTRVECGMPLAIGADGNTREIPLRVSVRRIMRKTATNPLLSTLTNLPIGSVSAMQPGGENQHYSLYLDLSAVAERMEVLTASFTRPVMYLGDVGDIHDASGNVQLRVSKSAQAGNEAIGYTLSFESSQQLNNHYRMRSAGQERMVPYQILVSGRELLPDSLWRGTVPAGSGTSDVVDVQFKLAGKQTRGMAAGLRLQDTVTAVIAPDS